MAAGYLPKPGTKAGPCKRCEHIDCKQTRADAAAACFFCEQPIGYGRAFVRGVFASLAHSACVESAVESADTRVAVFIG